MNCPKCGKVMLDVRSEKSNPKAPDFTCPDANCLNDKGYRTGAWLPKGKPAPVVQGYNQVTQPTAAIVIGPPLNVGIGTEARDAALIELYWDSFDRIMEGIAKRKLAELLKPEHIGPLVSTLYIQRARG